MKTGEFSDSAIGICGSESSLVLSDERIEELAIEHFYPDAKTMDERITRLAHAISAETLASLVGADREGERLITRLMTEINDLRAGKQVGA